MCGVHNVSWHVVHTRCMREANDDPGFMASCSTMCRPSIGVLGLTTTVRWTVVDPVVEAIFIWTSSPSMLQMCVMIVYSTNNIYKHYSS
jgi:hypothetical protein